MFTNVTEENIAKVLDDMKDLYMGRFNDWSLESDLEMAGMALSDLGQCMMVLGFLSQENFDRAHFNFARLDTCAREYLYESFERHNMIDQ